MGKDDHDRQVDQERDGQRECGIQSDIEIGLFQLPWALVFSRGDQGTVQEHVVRHDDRTDHRDRLKLGMARDGGHEETVDDLAQVRFGLDQFEPEADGHQADQDHKNRFQVSHAVPLHHRKRDRVK